VSTSWGGVGEQHTECDSPRLAHNLPVHLLCALTVVGRSETKTEPVTSVQRMCNDCVALMEERWGPVMTERNGVLSISDREDDDEELSERASAIEEALLVTPATSLADLRTKCRMTLFTHSEDLAEMKPLPDGWSLEMDLLTSLGRDIKALAEAEPRPPNPPTEHETAASRTPGSHFPSPLRHGTLKVSVEAARLAPSLRPLARLAQVQEPGGPSGEARGGRGVGTLKEPRHSEAAGPRSQKKGMPSQSRRLGL
jgi:hypothetical protein